MARNPADLDFHVSQATDPGDTLIAGFSAFGLAGLTAVDYLVDHLELTETGYIHAEGLPSITPFAEGRPHHHTRLFSREDLGVTVLASELFVPRTAGNSLAAAVLEWTESADVSDVAVLSGVPFQHGPEEHRTFYVATDDYRERNLTDVDVAPMGRGFFDGVNAALVERGLDSSLGVCVYVTPVHAQVPDVEAAVRLVETVDAVEDLGVDTEPLQAFAGEVSQYYESLAENMAEREEQSGEDRMYM